MERSGKRSENPAERSSKDEFLKTDAEIAMEFTFHSISDTEEVTMNSPESDSFTEGRRVEDPVRLLRKLEATASLEENY